MAVHEIFQQLVQKLYSSNLHFHLSETPFSAQILIRKKFLVDKSGVSSSALDCRNEEVSDLKCKIVELEKKVESSSDTNKILEKKLGQAEIQALKAYEEQKTKIDALKNNIKKNDIETINLTKSLETEQKVVKENNKLIQKLELKCENLAKNNKNMQTELKKVKNENKNLVKNRNYSRDLVETMKSGNLKHTEKDLNQNLPTEKVSQLCSSSLAPRAPSHSTPPNGTPSRPSPSATPPPKATSGSTASVVCETDTTDENNYKPILTQPVTTTTYPASTTSSCKGSSLRPSSAASICSHSLQCTTRQPRSPPSNKCSILIHHGSNYHEQIHSQAGVPYQLGMTHDYCMRIEYENYGCEDCKWFKRWGQLHGYPDINPWIFKEYRQPLTFL